MATDHVAAILENARTAIQPAEVITAESVRSVSVPARELVAVSGLVALADVTIFRGDGFGGLAVFWLLSPLLLALGRTKPKFDFATSIVAVMLGLLALRTAWLGSSLGTIWGAALLVAFSMTLAGLRPYLLEGVGYAVHLLAAGLVGWTDYAAAAQQLSPRIPRLAWLSLFLPLGAVVVFGAIFILANPDLVTALQQGSADFLNWLEQWAGRITFPGWEIAFCLVSASAAIALLRPLMGKPTASSATAHSSSAPSLPLKESNTTRESPLFGAIQNTLLAVIVLFAVYLVFEFRTLWFREFPKGFYYAGYAHRGAAWLTAALALATVVLSAIFQGDLLKDPRLPRLKRLAWIWSALNLVLALSVYNRMHIYVDFNGMTRMRMIGLFGITSVVVGFSLVLWKIVHRRDFVWLLRRQLWTVAVATYLFAITPVDSLVHCYNVRQILSGDLAPAVQITEHPVNNEGVLQLEPLLRCRDPIIREGILAMLAERAVQLNLDQSSKPHWSTFQLADQTLASRLQAQQSEWEPYLDSAKRREAWSRFREYAYQWY